MDITPPGGFKIIWNDIVVMTVAIKPKLALISFNHLSLSSLGGDKHFLVRFTNFLQTFFFGFSGFGISIIISPQLSFKTTLK
jgi:hypothetical protein